MPRHVRPSESLAGHRFLAGSMVVLVLIVLGTLGWSALHHDNATPAEFMTPSQSPSSLRPSPSPTPSKAQDAVFTIVASGDMLPHASVESDAKTGKDSYDFTKELSGLDAWVQGGDLAICHLEVPIAPKGTAVSAYPDFGAPVGLVRDLAQQGWDGCSNASNHSMDRGFAGVQATLAAFDKAGLGHAGTGRTKAEATSPQLYRLQRDGQSVIVAHISATFGINQGTSMPAGKPWSVELLDTKKIVAQAKAARAAGADLVVASIHDGTEYVTEPSADQVKVMKALAKSGEIDFVLGAHTHVPQPIVKLAGGVAGRGMWVAYGMGNTLSNQSAACCVKQTEAGELLTVTVTKPAHGSARVTDFQWTPITVDRTGGHRVYAISDVLSKPNGVGDLSHADLKARAKLVADAVGPAANERTTPPTPTGAPPTVVPHPGRTDT